MTVEKLSGAVVIDYATLTDQRCDVSAAIQEAFGNHNDALGIILIRGIPNYEEYRERLLLLASELAALPRDHLAALEDPESTYAFGWSHGKEIMKDGTTVDTEKGSYYANPILDVPTTDANLVRTMPQLCRPNIWPQEDLPEFEEAFKSLSRVMMETGALLARRCDQFISSQLPEYPSHFLETMVKGTRCSKARLLHYFPKSPTHDGRNQDSWCSWHLDHSCLTALTAAMFVDETEQAFNQYNVPESDDCGLYIKNRNGDVIKVDIPDDCLAIQTGEALEIVSRQFLKATPHCVRSPSNLPTNLSIARNTLACFIQPDWEWEMMPGYTFGEFNQTVWKKHY